jgi:hypothetical protein
MSLYRTQVKPSCGNNAFKLVCIEFADFPTGDRNNMGLVRESLLTIFQFQQVERRQGGISMNVDALRRTGLNVGQSGELCGLPKSEYSRPCSAWIVVTRVMINFRCGVEMVDIFWTMVSIRFRESSSYRVNGSCFWRKRPFFPLWGTLFKCLFQNCPKYCNKY